MSRSRRARVAIAEVATKAAFNRSVADLTMLEFLLNDRAAAASWPSARPAMNVVIDLRESRGAVTRYRLWVGSSGLERRDGPARISRRHHSLTAPGR